MMAEATSHQSAFTCSSSDLVRATRTNLAFSQAYRSAIAAPCIADPMPSEAYMASITLPLLNHAVRPEMASTACLLDAACDNWLHDDCTMPHVRSLARMVVYCDPRRHMCCEPDMSTARTTPWLAPVMRHHLPFNTPPPMLQCEHINQELTAPFSINNDHRPNKGTRADAPAQSVAVQWRPVCSSLCLGSMLAAAAMLPL